MRRQVRRMTACLLAAIMSIGMLSGLAQAEEALPESSDYEAAVLVEQAGEVTAEEWAAEEPEEAAAEEPAEEVLTEELAEEAVEEVPAEEPAVETPAEPVEEEPAAEAPEDETPAVEAMEEPEPEAEVPVIEETEEPAPEAEVPAAEDTEEPAIEAEELAEEPAEETTEEVLEEETVEILQEGEQEPYLDAYTWNPYGEQGPWTLYVVEENDTLTFQVFTVAPETSILTYEWEKETQYKEIDSEGNVNTYYRTETIEGADSDVYTTEPITEMATYRCYVRDQYGNIANVDFEVHLENHLYAYAEESGDEKNNSYECYVSLNEEVGLNVVVEADDTSDLTYHWYWIEIVERTDEEGNIQTFAENRTIEGANTGTYVTDPIRKYIEYQCHIEDQYGNYVLVYYYVHVDNQFIAYAADGGEDHPTSYDYTVEPGECVELRVAAEALDTSGITYEWEHVVEIEYEEPDGTTGTYVEYERAPGTENPSYTTGEIYKIESYYCTVTDRYGNKQIIGFQVYVDDSGDDPGDIPGDIPESMLHGENKLYAYVTGNEYQWGVDYYLVPDEAVDLSVTAGAIDPEGITYQWYRKPLTLYQGNFANAYNPNPLVALEGETANEFSVIPDSSYLYQCDVQDAYGNTTNVKIYAIVQNQLQAEGVGAAYSEGNVYYYNVHPGDSRDLTVSVSALDPEGVTYTWGTVAAVNEYGYTYSGFEPIEGAEGDTFTTGELNEDTIYCCQIADKYGDHIEVNFSIRVIEPGPILVGENELYAYVTGTEYLDETFCYLEPYEEVNLSVTAGAIDTEGMTIQWSRRPISLHNGVFAFSYNPNPFEPLEGVTTNEYSVVPDSSYTYQCTVSDAYENTKCVYFYVIVQNQLHLEGIDADDQTLVTYDYSVAPGTSKELKVSTTALDPEGIVYQWYKLNLVTDEDGFTYYDRLPIEGATSDTYTTEALYEYVEYYCEAIDKYGDHYGIQLNVSVNNALQAYVTGTDHLKTVNVYVQAGEEVELSVTAEANDLEGITYQWSKRDFSLLSGHDLGVSSSDPFTEIPGATGSVFTGVPEHTASYECVVTDAYGNTAIVFFRVIIQNIQSIQAIGANISEGNKHYYSIEPGTSAELQVSVNALDMEGITYQWYESPVNEEMPIEGATTDSFTTGVLNEEKTYVCIVSDEKYGDRYYWITFIVQTHADNELFAYITGTEHKKTINVYIQPDEEVELSVTVEANDLEGITYQWCKSNFNLMYGNNPDIGSSVPYTEIVGATESVFTGVPDHTALYLCEVDDAYGNTSFVVFRVMIQNIQSVQAVGADSSEEYTYYYSVAPNTSAELQVSVNALDPEGITYQWFDDSEKIEGATTDSYTTSALNEDAVYRCIVSDQKYGDEYRIYFSIEISEAPHEHTYISEVTKPATCTDPGVRTYTCTGCEDSYTEVIPALGHDLQFVAEVAPTVQASGCKAHYKCSRCDKLFLDAEGKTETTADILKTPQLKTGWQKVDGQWYYYDAAGEVCTGWTKVGKSWYYLGTDGAMTTGWKKVGKSWYYMNSSGVMQTDWQKIGGKWYYLGTNGVMWTKWQQIDEKWYYFGTDGKMVTGWKQISEKWYYFNSSGVMQTKWQQISGKWYYLGTDGVMCTGWQKISKKWYYLGTDGIMVTGWKKISSKWYYFNSSGVMMTGTQTIDGKSYTFDSSGVWTGK